MSPNVCFKHWVEVSGKKKILLGRLELTSPPPSSKRSEGRQKSFERVKYPPSSPLGWASEIAKPYFMSAPLLRRCELPL
jgi:hypothetical protein